jgi:hypothetical protein
MGMELLKKKNADNFTIMIVPHSGSSCFTINVSLFFIKFLFGLLIGSMIFAMIYNTFYLVSYIYVKTEAERLSVKLEEYRELEQQLDYYVLKTQNYKEKMMELQTLGTKIRDALEDDPAYKFVVNKNNINKPDTTPASKGN